MKKEILVDLITAHYKNDPRLFFQRTIDVLKEFKKNGDDKLVEHLDFMLKCNVKIAPKINYVRMNEINEEISFEDAEELGWNNFIPMTADIEKEKK